MGIILTHLDNIVLWSFYHQLATMSVGGLRLEDRLASAGNWSLWKARIVLILEEGELWIVRVLTRT
jgi:hypothetical protein